MKLYNKLHKSCQKNLAKGKEPILNQKSWLTSKTQKEQSKIGREQINMHNTWVKLNPKQTKIQKRKSQRKNKKRSLLRKNWRKKRTKRLSMKTLKVSKLSMIKKIKKRMTFIKKLKISIRRMSPRKLKNLTRLSKLIKSQLLNSIQAAKIFLKRQKKKTKKKRIQMKTKMKVNLF